MSDGSASDAVPPGRDSVSSGRDGLFYGWVVVGAVFVVLCVTSGIGFYNAAVILRAAKVELDASVTIVSAATALFFGISGATGFALSRLMDRVDLRWFYTAGGIIGAAALLGLRWVDSVAELFVFFAVFGVAFAVAGLVPSTTIVARWFNVRRSVALSIASTGLSVGGIAITPLSGRLIDDRSLAGAGPWLALAWFVGVVPIAWLLIRSSPADKGLEPDGAPTPPQPVALVGATFAEATGTRFFRFLSGVYALVFLAQVGAIAQLVNLGTERFDATTGTGAVSALALSSVVGRLGGGAVVTKVDTWLLTAVLVLVQGVGLSCVAVSTSKPVFFVGVIIFGFSVGNLLMLQPLLLAETFGVKHYSQIYSFNQLFGTIGVAGGPFLLGLMRDVFDYRISFLVAAACNVIGFALLMSGGKPARARASWDTTTAVPA